MTDDVLPADVETAIHCLLYGPEDWHVEWGRATILAQWPSLPGAQQLEVQRLVHSGFDLENTYRMTVRLRMELQDTREENERNAAKAEGGGVRRVLEIDVFRSAGGWSLAATHRPVRGYIRRKDLAFLAESGGWTQAQVLEVVRLLEDVISLERGAL